jgi:hypothetical protein
MSFRKILLIITLVSSTGIAQRPWEKPAEKWTDADARQILSGSPWAKSFTIVRTRNPPAKLVINIRWESALPIRLALRKAGLSPAMSVDYSSSTVVVIGFPNQGAEQKPEVFLKPASSNLLKPVDSKALEQEDHLPLFAFAFARTMDLTEPIDLRLPFFKKPLKSLSLRVKMGDFQGEQSFSADYMTFLGKPEL